MIKRVRATRIRAGTKAWAPGATAIGGAEEVSEKVSGTISTNWQKLSLTPFSDTIFRIHRDVYIRYGSETDMPGLLRSVLDHGVRT
ncbi:hypothetical protein GCM10027021_19660 [Dyella kyungheensis]